MDYINHQSIPPAHGVLEEIDNKYNNVQRTKSIQKQSAITQA